MQMCKKEKRVEARGKKPQREQVLNLIHDMTSRISHSRVRTRVFAYIKSWFYFIQNLYIQDIQSTSICCLDSEIIHICPTGFNKTGSIKSSISHHL